MELGKKKHAGTPGTLRSVSSVKVITTTRELKERKYKHKNESKPKEHLKALTLPLPSYKIVILINIKSKRIPASSSAAINSRSVKFLNEILWIKLHVNEMGED